MTRRRAPYIPQRRSIYIGCEGESETGYAALLQDYAKAGGLPVYLKIDVLGRGAGDPLARIEMAVQRIDQHSRKRIVPQARFVFLDADQAAVDVQRADRARRLAADNGISIIWQQPCFEAVLLRHLPGCTSRRPVQTSDAERALTREWPEYQKPMPRVALLKRIDFAGILRATAVEPGLAELLGRLGLQ